jgi:hypothetical protein
MPRKDSPYGGDYVRQRRALLGQRCHICGNMQCPRCGKYGSDSPDHVPSLHEHRHVNGSGCCTLRPSHLCCNMRRGGWRAATRVREIRRRSR